MNKFDAARLGVPAPAPVSIIDAARVRAAPGHAQLPMPPDPGDAIRGGCDASRVTLAGGALNTLMVDPMVVPFEQLYRRLPEEGMFSPSVNPSAPFAFDLGAFHVQGNMNLLLFDLRPDIYRFSGIDPGDFVPVEARRFGSIMGYELTIDGAHPGNIRFEVDPLAIPVQSAAFIPPAQSIGGDGVAQQIQFDAAASNSFANAAGAGLSLMPQRPTRYGAESVPFTVYVRSGQTVRIRCVIFRPIPSPIAFIEYDIAGMLLPEQYVNALNRCMSPTGLTAGGSGGPR